MSDINPVLAANHTAVGEFLAIADRTGAAWTLPRAAGKWSPAQVVEHVARSLDESANEVSGAASRFPRFPGFVRPLIRGLFFKRVLKKNAFPNVRTSKAFDPAAGPATPAEARVRLQAALARFDQACRARAASGQAVVSTVFGAVPVADYARFQELHTRHHCGQLPGAT